LLKHVEFVRFLNKWYILGEKQLVNRSKASNKVGRNEDAHRAVYKLYMNSLIVICSSQGRKGH